jgi:hypothetical protein
MPCYNSAIVPANADDVWAALRRFHDLGWARGVITQLDVVGDVPDGQVGARRLLNEAFHETLQSLDDAGRQFTYSIDDGPGPVAADAVANYIGRVRVAPVTVADSDATFVEWTSEYDSDDAAAVQDFCDPIYRALLSALKEHFA